MNVIGQCLDNGDSSGTSTLMDVYETLLVLVGQALLLPAHCDLNPPLGNTVTQPTYPRPCSIPFGTRRKSQL